MAKARVLLEREPKTYNECPFSDSCGWACRAGEYDECACVGPNWATKDDPNNFDFSKCSCCVAFSK